MTAVMVICQNHPLTRENGAIGELGTAAQHSREQHSTAQKALPLRDSAVDVSRGIQQTSHDAH